MLCITNKIHNHQSGVLTLGMSPVPSMSSFHLIQYQLLNCLMPSTVLQIISSISFFLLCPLILPIHPCKTVNSNLFSYVLASALFFFFFFLDCQMYPSLFQHFLKHFFIRYFSDLFYSLHPPSSSTFTPLKPLQSHSYGKNHVHFTLRMDMLSKHHNTNASLKQFHSDKYISNSSTYYGSLRFE